MSEKVYGIDLGTTYSCLAGFDEHGKVVVFDNDQMEPTTPSVVWFNGRTATVGSPAKEQAPVHPEAVVSAIKRKMGTDEATVQSGKSLRPEMVSALILKKLVKDARSNGENVRKVVITCPAYFGVAQREATKRAGELAGLEVLSIVNEPSAAAFSYGLEQESLDGKTVLVFDLGGGTFDATVIRIGREIEVIATGGDSYLGGRDWDETIAKYFIERFCEETGYDRSIADDDKGFLAEMVTLAEKRKRQLTNATKAKVAIEQYGRTCSFEFTRDEFDAKTAGLMQSAILATRQVLKEAGQKNFCFNTAGMDILMVGGSTLMPQVAATLEREFGITPKSYRPHEAVARGAALYARQALAIQTAEARGLSAEDLFLGGDIGSRGRKQDFFLGGEMGSIGPRIRNVTSKSFGSLFLRDKFDKIGHVSNAIRKNTEVPFEPRDGEGVLHGETLYDNMTAVQFRIFENEEALFGGEIDPELCTEIGTMELQIPPLPAGEPVTIRMKIDSEGLLSAEGIHDRTGRRCHVSIKTEHVLAREEVNDARTVVDWFEVE